MNRCVLCISQSGSDTFEVNNWFFEKGDKQIGRFIHFRLDSIRSSVVHPVLLCDKSRLTAKMAIYSKCNQIFYNNLVCILYTYECAVHIFAIKTATATIKFRKAQYGVCVCVFFRCQFIVNFNCNLFMLVTCPISKYYCDYFISTLNCYHKFFHYMSEIITKAATLRPPFFVNISFVCSVLLELLWLSFHRFSLTLFFAYLFQFGTYLHVCVHKTSTLNMIYILVHSILLNWTFNCLARSVHVNGSLVIYSASKRFYCWIVASFAINFDKIHKSRSIAAKKWISQSNFSSHPQPYNLLNTLITIPDSIS